MLMFSKAVVRIDQKGNVRIEGALRPYLSRIRHFVRDERIVDASIRLRGNRLVMSGNITPEACNKVERFLAAECPVP